MFENLSDRLERSFKILKGEGKITEINVAETMKDVRRALLDADVNYKVAKEFTNKVKEKALGMNVLTAVKPGQLMVKLVHDELAELMGGEEAPLKLENRPAIILMSGLQGSGKTTFSGKLANLLKTKKGKKPLLVACDVFEGLVGYDHGLEVAEELARTRRDITALFASADITAIGLINGLRAAGLRVPEDVSVIGFDDVEYAKMCYPGLTTMRQNIMEKGRQAARLMIEAVQDHSLPREERIIPMELIERGTVKRVDGNQAYAQRPVSAF